MAPRSLRTTAGASRPANRGGYGTGPCFSPVRHARMRRPILCPLLKCTAPNPRTSTLPLINPRKPSVVPAGFGLRSKSQAAIKSQRDVVVLLGRVGEVLVAQHL